MDESFEVIVLGLGAMGSAAVYHLARRGIRVLGIDQFDPPHTLGSSHGDTRVIREAYFENPVYVPLVQRAYELWAELEKDFGEQLYLRTGGIMVGLPEGRVVSGTLRSAREHGLAHEVLDSAEIRKRFPGLHPSPKMIGVLEPRAGIVFPEKCVAAHLVQARKLGAHVITNEKVQNWKVLAGVVEVPTSRGVFRGKRLVLAAGAWLPEIARELHVQFQVERQVLLWFEALKPELFQPSAFPIHLWEYEPGRDFYGFPDLGTGVKIAFHHTGEFTSAERVDREVHERDILAMRGILEKFLPDANGEFIRGTVCLYTNTPDGHFLIDYHPQHPEVVVGSPCSGHGFKFAAAIGEMLADLAMGTKPRVQADLFQFKRFA
jgi:sarcosine oxidase